MNKTYTTEKSPEPAMSWDDYKMKILGEWKNLLARKDSSESSLQNFLECHPCMLLGNPGGECFRSAVITQPVLPSYNYRKPDFMWFKIDSMNIYPVLIEIEKPSKDWFVKKGHQTKNLTQALDQLADWKTWFKNPRNISEFINYYRLPDKLMRTVTLKPIYVLIYGRREEATRDEGLARKRASLARSDEILMTYDRLSPEPMGSNVICATIDKNGYRALSIPPTIQLDPFLATCLFLFKDKTEAVQKNPYLNQKRKDFLIRRFKYWDDWAKKREEGLIPSVLEYDLGDYE